MADPKEISVEAGRSRASSPSSTPGSTAPLPTDKGQPSRGVSADIRNAIPDNIERKYVRAVNSFYNPRDHEPAFKLAGEKIVTKRQDLLGDIMDIARARGWVSVKISGSKEFREAAYQAARSRGLDVQNYAPTPREQAQGNRAAEMVASREARQLDRDLARQNESPEPTKTSPLSERFMLNSHEQNARDPELRAAQGQVMKAYNQAQREPGASREFN